jgi:glycosyltransferase involved in cell wall biosynthesis
MRVRVGLDVSVLGDHGVFGLRSHLFGLVSALSRRSDVDLRLFHPWPVRGLERLSGAGPVRARCFTVPGLKTQGWEQLVLPAMACAYAVDVLHSPANTGPRVPLRPSVITLHDVIQYRPDAELPRGVRRYLQVVGTRALRSADAVVCVSEATRGEALDLLGLDPARVHVIPNGVAQEFFEVGRAWRSRAAAGVVIASGSTVSTKNLPTTLRAFARVAARRPGASLRLFSVIPGTERTIQRLADEAGCGASVELIAPATDADMARALAAADLLLFPSLREGFGLPIAEALAAGTPVVTSDRGAMRETASGAAMLVDPLDAEALAQAAVRVLAEPACADRLRRAGHARAAAFDWDAVAERTASLYRSLHGERERRVSA